MLIKRHLPPSLFTNKQRILSQGLQVTQTAIRYNKVCRGDDFLHVRSDAPPSGFCHPFARVAKGWQRGVAVLGVGVKHKGGGCAHENESVAGDAEAKEESVCIHHYRIKMHTLNLSTTVQTLKIIVQTPKIIEGLIPSF